MFIVFLKFAEKKENAGQFMKAHNQWIMQGIEDGVFLIIGSLKPNLGGAIIASNCTNEELSARLKQDPFIAEKVVTSETFEVDPKLANNQFSFLLNNNSTQ